jgi:hypothetical protein
MATSSQRAFWVTRLIAGGLVAGVGVFWAVAWVMTDGGTVGMTPDALPGLTPLLVWAVVAVPGFGGALHFRNRAAAAAARHPSTPTKGTPRELAPPVTPGTPQAAQGNTIVAHAMLEGPALLGGVLFILSAAATLTWVVLPLYALGALLAWPRREWFGVH